MGNFHGKFTWEVSMGSSHGTSGGSPQTRVSRLTATSRFGLTYEQCAEWNPRIIYTSNSGWGPKGEFRDRPSYDGIAQAFVTHH